MDRDTFADGIGAVTVIGSTVRLDFMIYETAHKDRNSPPEARFQHRIIMSLEGFLQSVEKLSETAKTLSKLNQQPQKRTSEDAAQNGAAATQAAATPAAADAPSKPYKRPFP